MSTMHEELQGYHGVERGFPWKSVIGLILSVALTLIALWVVQADTLPRGPLTTVILLLALAQIAVQLIFFMHFTESIGPKYHITALTLGIFFTFVIIAASIWIMTFGGYEAY